MSRILFAAGAALLIGAGAAHAQSGSSIGGAQATGSARGLGASTQGLPTGADATSSVGAQGGLGDGTGSSAPGPSYTGPAPCPASNGALGRETQSSAAQSATTANPYGAGGSVNRTQPNGGGLSPGASPNATGANPGGPGSSPTGLSSTPGGGATGLNGPGL